MVRVEEQHREHGPRLSAAQLDRTAAPQDLDTAEQ